MPKTIHLSLLKKWFSFLKSQWQIHYYRNYQNKGLFFRAEDFNGFIRSINELRNSFDKDFEGHRSKVFHWSEFTA